MHDDEGRSTMDSGRYMRLAKYPIVRSDERLEFRLEIPAKIFCEELMSAVLMCIMPLEKSM